MSFSAARKKKKSRESEIALLEKISTSLDTYIGDNPPTPKSSTPKDKKKKKKALSETSKNAAKNFLEAKTLVKSIAKACAREKVVVTEETDGKSDELVESFVEEYQGKYPSVTKKLIIDAIIRHNALNNEKASADNDVAEDGDDDNDELKFGRIVPIVDAEMNQYHEKIEALKKARELAALQPEEKPKKKRKEKDDDPNAPPKKQKPPPKPKKVLTEKQVQEKFMMDEILKRYAAKREHHDRLPNGVLESIVEETKMEHNMESFDVPVSKIDKKIRRYYNKMTAKSGETRSMTGNRAIVEEVYQRYCRTKEANGGKLPPGTMDSIIEGVKLEYGLSDVRLSSLKTKVQARFTKENPQFVNCGGDLKIGKLSAEDKRRRQHLLNEITSRYIQEKERHPKKLADGTLDRIIEDTKIELGITDFEVHKASIRGRINRKSLYVQTLGSESPYDVVDEPLVSTINSWLSQGISVTRAQGLDLANRLLKGKNQDRDSNGLEIVLDAKWWRNFLERNKRKLVCSGE